jgi:hypothetical protein
MVAAAELLAGQSAQSTGLPFVDGDADAGHKSSPFRWKRTGTGDRLSDSWWFQASGASPPPPDGAVAS